MKGKAPTSQLEASTPPPFPVRSEISLRLVEVSHVDQQLLTGVSPLHRAIGAGLPDLRTTSTSRT